LAAICAHEGCDFYHRLTYYVTDRSARMLDDVAAAGTLAPHDHLVRFGRVDALEPGAFSPRDGAAPVGLGELRAVVHSYVLDGLPFDVVLRNGEAWMRLHYRTSIDETGASAIDPAWHGGDDGLAELLPLSERLFVDQAYLSLDVAELPFGQLLAPFAETRIAADAAAPARTQPSFVHSHGALTSLTRAIGLLRPHGFVLFHDYACSDGADGPDKHQRFARSDCPAEPRAHRPGPYRGGDRRRRCAGRRRRADPHAPAVGAAEPRAREHVRALLRPRGVRALGRARHRGA
jgi:hypothetical protein